MRRSNTRARTWRKRTVKVAAKIAAMGTITDNEEDARVHIRPVEKEAIMSPFGDDEEAAVMDLLMDALSEHDDIFETESEEKEKADIEKHNDSDGVLVLEGQLGEEYDIVDAPGGEDDEADFCDVGAADEDGHGVFVSWKYRGWGYGGVKSLG